MFLRCIYVLAQLDTHRQHNLGSSSLDAAGRVGSEAVTSKSFRGHGTSFCLSIFEEKGVRGGRSNRGKGMEDIWIEMEESGGENREAMKEGTQKNYQTKKERRNGCGASYLQAEFENGKNSKESWNSATRCPEMDVK